MDRGIIDRVCATLALVAVSPVLVLAAIGVKVSSPGPVFYGARRIARDRRRPQPGAKGWAIDLERRRRGYRGREFTLYKFRTMSVRAETGSEITAHRDSRVFPFGALLRATKIDELPQLINVIKGEMAFVGPRPEAPAIVRRCYTPEDLLTLQVLPGLTSPGSVYYYTHCETRLVGTDPTNLYTEQILPTKLAIDRVYLGHATLFYDLRIIGRTTMVMAARALGWTRFPDPPELARIPR